MTRTTAAPAPASRRPPLGLARGALVWALAILSGLALWIIVYALVLTPFEMARSQNVMYSKLRETLALQTAPLGGALVPGTPVALLSAPSLGLNDLVVVEGTSSGDLMAGPGHRSDTVLPGQAGVAVLYGRGTLFGGPFAGLERARKGDRITVTTGQGVFTYQVLGNRVAGQPMPPLLAAGKGRLTLVTSASSGVGALMHAPAARYIDAALQDEVQPSPGHPAAVPTSEGAMKGDPGVLLPLLLALPLALAALVYAIWAWSRWGGWQAWVTGLPLVLASLWLVSQATVQLLPNLL